MTTSDKRSAPRSRGKSYRHRELARIHILAKERGLDDDTYRAVLEEMTGARSAGGLSGPDRRRVIAHLEGRREGRPAPGNLDCPERGPLLRKVGAFLADARPPRPWEYADAIAERMFGIERVEFCSPPMLAKVVAALAIDARRGS